MPGEDPWTGIPPTWCAPCRGRPAKNQANISKHGVAFETAKRIFEGPMVTTAGNTGRNASSATTRWRARTWSSPIPNATGAFD